MDTYVTLSVLLICFIIAVVNLLKAFYQHEKKNFHTYDFPLDNKNKWWYN